MARLPLVFTNKRRFRTDDPKNLAADLERFVDDIKRAYVESADAAEASEQMLHCWCAGTAGGSTSARFLRTGSDSSVGATDENLGVVLAPCPGTLTRLHVRFGTALATANVAFTVRVNGSDTALTVTVPATTLAGSIEFELADGIPVVAGDRVTIKMLATASDGTTSNPRGSVAWIPAEAA